VLLEYRIVTRDGEIRWISHTCRAVYGKDGTYLGRRATNRDITARKDAEQALQEQYKALAETEEMFRNPVEHSPVGVYLQQDDVIRYANPRFAEMLGYTKEEILNQPFGELVDPGHSARACVPGWNRGDAGAAAQGRHAEITGRKKDGTAIDLEIFEAPMIFKGRPAHYGTLVDITERKMAEAAIKEREEELRMQNLDLEASNEEVRAISETLQQNYDELARSQEALAESEERVRSILESAAEAIYGIDNDGNCTFYNPACARLTGYTEPGELIGKNMHTLLHNHGPDGKPIAQEQCRIAQAYHEGKGIHFEDEVYWRADGTSFPVEIWAYPQIKDGIVTGMVITFFDITERKQMEEEIKRNLGEKEMLLKEIHHRVKNNMQVISGLLLIQSQTLKDDNVRVLFGEAMNRIKSIALVHEQLYRSDNLSQIEYGGYLRKMFGPLFESYKADARRIAMVIEAENIMVTIEKAVPCSLIVNELMSNSLKYAFPGDRKGEIRIRFSLDESGENYILDYSDNGIGMPEGFVPGKTGSLGTTLINGLTRQLKGTLTLDRDSPGVHYHITFPARDMRGK
jgi:PAS domain S-box-containing protein